MAGRIPADFIAQLLDRTDIVELIDRRVSLRRVGKEYSACCPFHDEKTPSFTVSPSKQFYHCFGCGAHGNAIQFLMDYERLEFVDAVEELAQQAGLTVPREAAPATHDDGQQRLFELLLKADRFFQHQLRHHPQRQRAVDYLRQRGLDGQTAAAYGIGYAPPGWDNLVQALTQRGFRPSELLQAGLAAQRQQRGGLYDRFRDRIIFPIRDRRGRPIGFGGRAIAPEDKPKYLNSPETPLFHKGRALYGLYEARQRYRQLLRVVVVEGYMDVIALAQHDLGYAVATLGTSTTNHHLEQLFRATSHVIFCFDGDRAGREAGWRALDQALALLRDGRQVSFLYLPEGEDPDTLVRQTGKAGFEAQLDGAKTLSEVFFERLMAQTDMHTLDGRARLAQMARPLLKKLPEGDFRDMMWQRLMRIAQIETVKPLLSTSRSAPAKGVADKVADHIDVGRTSIRRVIALILHYPHFAQMIAEEIAFLSHCNLADATLLKQMIEVVRNRPHINTTAALLVHFERHPSNSLLQHLARWQPEISEEAGLREEFKGLWNKFYQRYSNAEGSLLDKIIQRGAIDALSEEERIRLRQSARPTSS